jgi:hypothetical protein
LIFSTSFNELVMKNSRLLLLLLLSLIVAAAQAGETGEARDLKQAELDASCETARQEKLSVVREKYVEECIEQNRRPDRESCERFYADYGQSAGGSQVPLFYDLPQCVEADEHRRSYRNSSR